MRSVSPKRASSSFGSARRRRSPWPSCPSESRRYRMKEHKLGRGSGTWKVHIHEGAAREILALGRDKAEKVRDALLKLQVDPLRARSGSDVKKVMDLDGGGMYRLRVGDHRVVYAAIFEDREILVLVADKRERGYARLLARAEKRLAGVPRE